MYHMSPMFSRYALAAGIAVLLFAFAAGHALDVDADGNVKLRNADGSVTVIKRETYEAYFGAVPPAAAVAAEAVTASAAKDDGMQAIQDSPALSGMPPLENASPPASAPAGMPTPQAPVPQPKLGITASVQRGFSNDSSNPNFWVLGKPAFGADNTFSQATRLAEQGDPEAQNAMGMRYYNGDGVDKDYSRAEYWFRKAADQGYASAQNNLGHLHQYGNGVPQDYERAAQWYRKAAEQGNASAQNSLGNSYYKGRAVRQDYAEAASWFRKAAEQGNAPAQSNLGGMYRDGKGVGQDYAQAAQWYGKAAAQGNATAQSNLGYMYRHGQGVVQDNVQAAQWYRKAAEQGHAGAQNNLGYMYHYGLGVDRDYAEAERWYSQAAGKGDDEARQNLANLGAETGRSFQTVLPPGGGGQPYYARQHSPGSSDPVDSLETMEDVQNYLQSLPRASDYGGWHGLYGGNFDELPEYGLK